MALLDEDEMMVLELVIELAPELVTDVTVPVLLEALSVEDVERVLLEEGDVLLELVKP